MDLHAHTTASDGDQTPTQLVKMAKSVGLTTIAVTDHDTLGGLHEAIEAGRSLGVEVIPGIEISCVIERGQCHMLGLFIDPDSPQLKHKLQELQDARRARNDALVKKLNDLGIPFALEDAIVFAGRDLVARPHFARALVAKGVVSTLQEAFDRYLAEGAAASVPKEKLSPAQGIEMIKEAGGAAILAHPNNLKLPFDETLQALLRMKDVGLDGYEARYNSHTAAETSQYLHFAKNNGFITAGGSDFHGPTVKPAIKLGEVECGQPAPIEMLNDLKAFMRTKNELLKY